MFRSAKKYNNYKLLTLNKIRKIKEDTKHLRTFFFHANFSTTPQTTGLTPPSHPHVHLTVATILALINCITCYAAPKKP